MSLNLFSSTYLILLSKYFLTEKSLQLIIDLVSDVDKLNNTYLSTEIKRQFNIADSEVNNNKMKNIFKNTLSNIAHHPQYGLLKNSYLRKKYFKSKFNYVVPIKIVLQKENKNDFFYYIPIIETLNVLMKNELILLECLVPHESKNGIFTDIFDGCV